MTLIRRWRSFKLGGKAPWLLLLAAVSSFLLIFLSGRSQTLSVSSLSFGVVLHLFYPAILIGLLWHGPLWGFCGAAWSGALILVVALALRRFDLLYLPLEFMGLAWVAHAGVADWLGILRVGLVKEERLEEEFNTLGDGVHRLRDVKAGLHDRLQRYQKLRQVANAFSSTFSLEDLIQSIVQATGQLVEKGDLVLLYLLEAKTLSLELKAVWRRSGSVTIKAKQGDPFDLWVMRQAQPLLVQEPDTDFRFSQIKSKEVGRPLGSLLAVPLFSEQRLLGVLRVESLQPHGLGPEELRFVRILGDLASLGIENSRLYNRMADLASTDDLTGLAVRTHFQKKLAEELARSKGLQISVSILLIDIDRFKTYNDTFGHSAGDKLLKHLAQLLLKIRHSGETVARFGGEEFVCLLPGTDAKEAARTAEEIRVSVKNTQVELRRSLTQTTVSIGVATFPQDGEASEALLKVADDRLYQAKARGRNQVCVV